MFASPARGRGRAEGAGEGCLVSEIGTAARACPHHSHLPQAGEGELRPARRLLDGHRLGQIARLIDVAAAAHRDVIRQQLQRQNFEQRDQQFWRRR